MYKKFVHLKDFQDKKVLDIWCGGWWKSIYLAEKFNSDVVWIDLNETFLKQAKDKSKEKAVNKKTKFLIKDALNTWFKDGEFDVIIMSDVLEHIPNTESLLKESYRILKKGWFIIFDFAPYYHYFGHHLWDTIQVPWLHVFTTEKFRIKLYKESVKLLDDGKKRIDLRIWRNWKRESFTYLNRITRKDFENILKNLKKEHNVKIDVKYYMLKKLNFLSKIPLFRELFIRHIVWVIKK